MKWAVEFGSVQKLLDEVHPDTGLPTLIAATKARIEATLKGEYAGLVVVFRVHPTHGLTYTFRGPEPEVKAALATLGIGPASAPLPPARFSLQRLPSENQIASSTREPYMDDPKQTEDPKSGSEKPSSETKPIVDQVTDVAADATAELASTAVKALSEGAKKAIKKRTPKPIKKAVAAVNEAAVKTRAKKTKSKKAMVRTTKTAARKTKKTKKGKKSKKAVAKRAKPASEKSGKKSSTKSRQKRSKSKR